MCPGDKDYKPFEGEDICADRRDTLECGVDMSALHKKYYSGTLTMLNMFAWLRTISFLRVFENTRIFIFMLI